MRATTDEAPTMLTTLNLTLAEAKAHDAELLAKIKAAPKPMTLAELFSGFRP